MSQVSTLVLGLALLTACGSSSFSGKTVKQGGDSGDTGGRLADGDENDLGGGGDAGALGSSDSTSGDSDGKPTLPGGVTSEGDEVDLPGIGTGDGALTAGCRYFDPKIAGTEAAAHKLPVPLVVDPRLGPAPVPATSVPHAGAAAFLSGGPTIDVTGYTLQDRGAYNGSDYLFSVTAYKDAGSLVGGVLGGSPVWRFDQPVGPRLAEATYKVTIKDARSAACSLASESIPVTRGDLAGSPNGCFDPKTEITLADGSSLPIALIKVGDRVRNPLGTDSARVVEVIYGPETLVGMYEVATTSGRVMVTAKHPFETRAGLKEASELTKSDEILAVGGRFEPLLNLVVHAPNPDQRVYNIRLESAEQGRDQHLVIANGVVTGDLFLQRELQRSRRESPPEGLMRLFASHSVLDLL